MPGATARKTPASSRRPWWRCWRTDLALKRGGDAARMEDHSLEEVENLLVRKAMDRFAGNVSQAARALGLSRSALYRRLEKHGQ